jgi:urease accessory protein
VIADGRREGADSSSRSPGIGDVAIVRCAGRSVVARAYATSPLRLLTPRNHGRAAWVYTSTFGGGLVGGDATVLDVEVGPGAAAFLSTQASTKVYRSTRGAAAEVRARVGGGGLFVTVPDPVVPFAASRYRQVQRIELAGDAGLVLVDWMSSGRRASGERWAFDEYDAALSVRVDSAPVLYDRLALRAADGCLKRRLGRFDVLAAVVIVGAALRDEASAIIAAAEARPFQSRPDHLVAAARLEGGGCIARVAGASSESVGGTVRRLLAFVPALLGDDPWARKW